MDEIKIKPQIEASWHEILKDEFDKEYFLKLKKFILEEKEKYRIYPKGSEIFNAFNKTPFYSVKVVIIGQDPYHNPGQAHGLCFSVPKGVSFPPSLQNIFKELVSDIGVKMPSSGDLTPWAEQGVLMLNAILTVRENTPESHRNKGWEQFTDMVIYKISMLLDGVIFLLWGNYAQQKIKLIDINKHYILKASHPSPFSANMGFIGCRHFSKVNEILERLGKGRINWELP